MTATVYYANAAEAVPVTPVLFVNAAGTATDPTVVQCVVTDPTGTSTTYNYNGSPPNNIITRSGTGAYALKLTGLTLGGLYTFVWIGTGATVNQVTPGTFRLIPISDIGSAGMQFWYASMEELKSRLSITDTGDDHEIQLVLHAVTDWINTYCGRHFYQITEARTYRPDNVWTLHIDDLVTATSVDLDYDGDGVYEVHWVQDVNYQLLRYDGNYNKNDMGIQRPNNYLQVTSGNGTSNPAGGQWLPWLWPFTRQNRVQITGTWGWPQIPPNVSQAALIMAADMFKAKDAPWGIAGFGELGLVKTQASPMIVELLRGYVNVNNKVGV
jgi:hypothetical protein